MASTVPHVTNHTYIAIRQKMSEELGGIIGRALFSRYEETNDLFFIGGLVHTYKTLMASAIRHYCHLVNFRFTQNNRLYLIKVLYGFMTDEPIKIYLFY
jgi:hypothetical protein